MVRWWSPPARRIPPRQHWAEAVKEETERCTGFNLRTSAGDHGAELVGHPSERGAEGGRANFGQEDRDLEPFLA